MSEGQYSSLFSNLNADNLDAVKEINPSYVSSLKNKFKGTQNHLSILPIKYTKQLSNELLEIIRGKDLKEIRYESIRDLSVKAELIRFISVLLWYKDNIKERYMEPEEILWRSIKEGSSFADELADTLKYSIRTTLSERTDDICRDYPVLKGSIDYIFDPKCLFHWEATNSDDYLWLLKPPKEINHELVDQVLGKVKLPEKFHRPDVLDMLKLFRKSKIMSDGINTTEAWKHFIKLNLNKVKYPSTLRFKSIDVHKYPDERRDILISDPETLYLILECQFYLQQILSGTKGYMKDRTKVYYRLKSHKHKKYIMTDLKKSGLSISRKLCIKFFNFIYEKTGLSCFNILKHAIEDFIIYRDEKPIFTTEGKGLGVLDEIVTIIIATLFTHVKEDIFAQSDVKGWFFNDDQLIIVDDNFEEVTYDTWLKQWNEALTQTGFTVHGEKPWIGNYGQFCEVYSPQCPIDMEKRTRQFHILISPIHQHVSEAKSIFSNNYGKWWGMKDKDYQLALEILHTWFGDEFPNDDTQYPYELGGWYRYTTPDKFNKCLVIINKNWSEPNFDKHRANLLQFESKIVNSKKNLEYTKKHKILIKANVEDKNVLSLDSRLKMLSKGLKVRGKYDLISKQKEINDILKARQNLYKEKIDLNKFIEIIKEKEWNEYIPPPCILLVGNKTPREKTILPSEFSECDDIVRLYNTYIKEYQVRKPCSGDLTSIFKTYIADIDKFSDRLYNPWNYDCLLKLSQFSTRPISCYNRLLEFTDGDHVIDLTTEIPKISIIKDIIDLTVDKNSDYQIVCWSGGIFKIPDDMIPEIHDWVLDPRSNHDKVKEVIYNSIQRRIPIIDSIEYFNFLTEIIDSYNSNLIGPEDIITKVSIHTEEEPIKPPEISNDIQDNNDLNDYINAQAAGWFNSFMADDHHATFIIGNEETKDEIIDPFAENDQEVDYDGGGLFD